MTRPALLLGLLGFTAPAWAQSTIFPDGEVVDGQAFEPAISGEFFLVEQARPDLPFISFRGLLHYDRRLFRMHPSDGSVDLVGDLVGLDAMGSIATGPVRFGVDVPLVFLATSDVENVRAGIGDLRFDGRLTVLGRRESVGGLAIRAGVRLPSSTIQPYLASGLPVGELAFVGDRTVGRVLLAGSVGIRRGPDVEVGNESFGTWATGRFGVSVHPDTQQGLTAEVALRVALKGLDSGQDVPAEALLGYWREIGKGWVFRTGLGAGISPAPDAPQLRLIVGIERHPLPPPPDPDGDGMSDGDQCPNERETVNGIRDADGCPEHPTVLAKVPGAADPDAGPPAPVPMDSEAGLFDPDGDGLADRLDYCKDEAEDVDGFEDGDGCPEPDDDLDTVLDDTDACARVAETHNGWQDVDGCPDAVPDWLAGDAVPTVLFEPRSTKLNGAGRDLLVKIASAMEREQRLELRIDGHSDNVGTPEYNMELSKRRAEAVQRWLIGRGIDSERLRVAGHGATEPVDTSDTEEGRARNRRVDLSFDLKGEP